MIKFDYERVENIVGKGENTGHLTNMIISVFSFSKHCYKKIYIMKFFEKDTDD